MRDDFTQQTVDTLAKRVGVRCSNPGCRQLTTGPRSDITKIVNIGVGAHITAAAPGGPRFDESLSSEQRKSSDNAIWLCQNCAKLIDNDSTRYTVDILKKWKDYAEKVALTEIEGGKVPPENSIDVEIIYKKIKLESERHDYLLEVITKNLSDEPISSFHVDLEFPARVVEQPEKLEFFIEDRSSRDVSFFRATYRDDEIYPGDTKLIISIPYYMDHEIYYDRGNLFDMPVRTTFFRKGYIPLVVEKLFGELQSL